MNKLSILTVAALSCLGTMASATTLDFDAVGPGDILNGMDLGGVTLTSLGDIKGSGGPNGTTGLLANDGSAFQPITATFGSLASFVSIDLGDYNSDADDLFLYAYDSLMMLIASDTYTIAASFVGMHTLSVSGSGISYVEFGGVGLYGESNVYADNLTFTTVPLPAGGLLLLGGLGLLGAARRRKT